MISEGCTINSLVTGTHEICDENSATMNSNNSTVCMLASNSSLRNKFIHKIRHIVYDSK